MTLCGSGCQPRAAGPAWLSHHYMQQPNYTVSMAASYAATLGAKELPIMSDRTVCITPPPSVCMDLAAAFSLSNTSAIGKG